MKNVKGILAIGTCRDRVKEFGDKLGIPVYLAAVIVFGGRIFNNFAIIRRLIIDKLRLHNEVKR